MVVLRTNAGVLVLKWTYHPGGQDFEGSTRAIEELVQSIREV